VLSVIFAALSVIAEPTEFRKRVDERLARIEAERTKKKQQKRRQIRTGPHEARTGSAAPAKTMGAPRHRRKAGGLGFLPILGET
jgi:hypothetical protein